MELVNHTPFPTLFYSALDVQDREYRVMVMKVVYQLIPKQDQPGHFQAIVQDEDAPPLCLEDTFHGEMNQSSEQEESDLAPFKPKCDVLLHGTGYAPGGKAVPAFPVRLQVGDAEGNLLLDKQLRVTGERHLLRSGILGWAIQGSAWSLSDPEPCLSLPIRYEYAYGGQCRIETDHPNARDIPQQHRLTPEQIAAHPTPDNPPIAHTACEFNPVGRAYAEEWWLKASDLQRLPAPRLESPSHPFTVELFMQAVSGKASAASSTALRPQGFGPIGRPWLPRRTLAGTYDQTWVEKRHPYLPKDFDFGYWNCAPKDQQISYPPADLRIGVLNMVSPQVSPNGQLVTQLPGHRAFVLARFEGGTPIPMRAVIDTLTLNTDALTLACVWRCLIPADLPLETLEARFETDPKSPLMKFEQDEEQPLATAEVG